jgi:PKD repeat protein
MNIKPINRLGFALFLLIMGSLSVVTQANAGSCENSCLSIYSITLTDLGTSIRASVKVIDEFANSGASRSATVQGMWTRPDGSTILQYGTIGTRLRADMKFGTGGVPGTYTFEVIDIIKPGYTFDPTAGANPVARITIQNTYNQSPIAVINTDLVSGDAPLNVNFDAMSSNDPDGTISTYLWNFGDGSTSTEPSISHTYTVSGGYTATLTVLDNLGARADSSVIINVADPAPPNTTGCQTQCLSLDEFKMNLKRDMVIGKVRVLDESSATVYDVTIYATWTLPDGSIIYQTKQNGSRKQTTFKIPATQSGTYTLSVISVTKAGYQYDTDNHPNDSGSLLVE